MHSNDLLDTILVTRKDEPHTNPGDSSTGPGANPTAARPNQPAMSDDATTANTAAAGADACPVDHKTREIWLQQARASGSGAPANPHGGMPAPGQAQAQPATAQPSTSPSSSWSPWSWFSPSSATSASSQPVRQQQSRPHTTQGGDILDTTRTVSSIPRSSVPGPSSCPAPAAPSPAPANHESETGADRLTGNWIYPSEKMFFDAMRRKGFSSTTTADMKTVVPIHNAVNERAWAEIKAWEAPYGSGCAEGPRLHSFAGVKERMTPRARIKTLLGYTAPFDRHDWVVDRCGKQVEYVIDFYAGRPDNGEGKVNFYLDVRPKVNSWEGVKMRALRGVGLA